MFGNHQGRTSDASTVLTIWVNGAFRPVRFRLLLGKAELLSGMHIVKKLGAQLCFGIDRFKVGHCECEMMAFNEKHHWVFPLAPTACDYSKFDEYLGKLREAEIDVTQTQGDLGGNLAVRKVSETKSKIVEQNGEIRSDNFGYERHNSKFITDCGSYDFWMFRGGAILKIEGRWETVSSRGIFWELAERVR